MAGSVAALFTRRPGIEQGRVANPEGFVTPEGDAALVLGADTPKWTRRVALGDKFDVFQSDAVGAAKILRFAARVRGPDTMPAMSVLQPYALADGQTLRLAIDGGGVQIITFSAGQFTSIAAATALEVRDAINSQLTGATAFLSGTGLVGVLSATTGRDSRVEVLGGTATALGLAELAWYLRLLLAGSVVASVEVKPGLTRDLSDMAGNLAAHGDPVEVRLRLEVQSK